MEELKQLLPDGLQGADTFALYLSTYPKLRAYASENLARLQQSLHSTQPREIEAGRDAANNLFMVAQEAGFLLAAAIFYHRYESLSLKLLSWYPD